MNGNNAADQRKSYKIAGIAALFAGSAWVCWGTLNGITGGALDSATGTVEMRLAKFGQLLTIGWNLLLIPGALVLWRRLQKPEPEQMLLFTVCGVLSLTLWAIGGAARVNSPMLEVSYLLLSGIWWTGMGSALRKRHKVFGTFTIVVGVFALLDATLSFFEPMPFYIYALAAPKLPLAIVWDFWLGFFLLTSFEESMTDKTAMI